MRATRHWRLLPLLAALVVGGALAVPGESAAEPRFEHPPAATPYDRSGWVWSAPSGDAALAGDGDSATAWSGDELTADLGESLEVGGLRYTPPVLGTGQSLADFRVEALLADGWSEVAAGTWPDDASVKTVTFAPVTSSRLRLAGTPAFGAAEVELFSPQAAQVAAAPPPHPTWGIAVSSEQPDAEGSLAIDGDPDTAWKSAVGAFPHYAVLDTGALGTYSGIRYRPAADGGGTIGGYRVWTSPNNSTWTKVAEGAFDDDTDLKTVEFASSPARYVRFVASSAASNRSSWVSAAELDLVVGSAPEPFSAAKGTWTPPLNFPIIPAAVALMPNGKVVAWSADGATSYAGAGGKTHTVIYDPVTRAMSHVVVTNTGQDMFCPGIAMLADGRLMVNGGHLQADRVSVYDSATNTWKAGAPMVLTRGYQASTTLADGTVFITGGSWGDTNDVKDSERWALHSPSVLLPGAPVAPILTQDKEGVFRSDNHAWLFTWGSRVFQAGPSRTMHWYTPGGTGAVASAGPRADDGDAMNGAAAMYAAGKILAVGGSPDYLDTPATAHATMISLTGSAVKATRIGPMHYPRSFASAVVLPDASVLVVGGMQQPKTFSDATAVLEPELWRPATQKFSLMARMQVPRTYHSVALLLPDGRVLVGGGGLCAEIEDCENANHANIQVFTPPYLLTPSGGLRTRPVITSYPATAAAGQKITVKTGSKVSTLVLIRASAVTHSVNTDQRRILLPFTGTPSAYTATLPADRGHLVPGAYMLFAMGTDGTPSNAKFIRIR